MAKVKELKPTVRPKMPFVNATEFPTEPPVKVPMSNSEPEILAWCEELRNEYEKNEKKKLTVKGLLHMADVSGLDPSEIKQVRITIKKLYGHELKPATATPAPKAKPAKDKKPKKDKKPAKSAKGNKKIIAEKPSANGNGKPAKPEKKKDKKPAKPARTQVEAVLVYDKKVRGIDVKIYQTEKGKFRVSFDGTPMRGVMRFLGANNWDKQQVEETCCKLLAGTGKTLAITVQQKVVKGHESYVHEIVGGGHVSAGQKAGLPKPGKKGKKSCFGKTPILEADAFKRLKAVV